MDASWTPETTGIGRTSEIVALLHNVDEGHCCSMVGMSNVGKSTLLRALARPQVLAACGARDAQHLLVAYVDLNCMLTASEQGFYEAILRAVLQALDGRITLPGLDEELRAAYDDVVSPPSAFTVPLAFNRALTALLRANEWRVVLLLDELDDSLSVLEGRLYLNLRALRDQYGARLVYVTGTNTRLEQVREQQDTGLEEFCELFAAHVHTLQPLCPADAQHLLSTSLDAPLPAWASAQIVHEAGGHPGLLRAAAFCAARQLVPASTTGDKSTRERSLAALLDSDAMVRSECARLWEERVARERRALEEWLATGTSSLTTELSSLIERGFLLQSPTGLACFAALWQRYVLRQREARRPTVTGVRIDVETNEVWVDGAQVPALTPLEYRLLLLLYGHLGQVCTKENIVEAVYGRDYIPEDDAALQRLVRRLREKLEEDPAQPRYVLSIRGYGYKLAEADQSPL